MKKIHKKKYKKNKSLRIFIFLVLFFLISIYGFLLLEKKIKPTVLSIAEVKIKEVATRSINESVNEKFANTIKYEDLILIKTDNEGNIEMLQANTVKMNKIASEVALLIQDNISNFKSSQVSIPLGNILGSQLLSQWGPMIKINIVPIGMAKVNFKTEFEASGINQTRHKIYLDVNTQAKIIVPFSSSITSVQTTIPITETVIVGDVPDSYIYVPEDEVLNVVE